MYDARAATIGGPIIRVEKLWHPVHTASQVRRPFCCNVSGALATGSFSRMVVTASLDVPFGHSDQESAPRVESASFSRMQFLRPLPKTSRSGARACLRYVSNFSVRPYGF